jgi:hypothetical protein
MVSLMKPLSAKGLFGRILDCVLGAPMQGYSPPPVEKLDMSKVRPPPPAPVPDNVRPLHRHKMTGEDDTKKNGCSANCVVEKERPNLTQNEIWKRWVNERR